MCSFAKNVGQGIMFKIIQMIILNVAPIKFIWTIAINDIYLPS